MKKILLSAGVLVCMHVSNAQNTNPWPATGNIGIGTNSPQATLHVSGGQIIETIGSVTNTRTLTLKNNGTNQINFGTYPGAWRSSIQIQSNDASKGLFVAPPELDYNYSLFRSINGGFKLDVGGNFSNSGATAMTIESDGKVGIGTTNPGSKLEVLNAGGGTAQQSILRLAADGDGWDRVDFEISPGGTTDFTSFAARWGNNWHWQRSSSEGRVRQMSLLDNGRLDLYYTQASMNDVKVRLNPAGDSYFMGGNIAIGTTDPKGYRLAVNGDAIFTKVKVKQYGNWPDYVFQHKYRLRPLNEVEQYIQQYGHLPEVPSAAEVEKEGLDVGDNQAMLLKKIEELTLYVIQQQKEIEGLKKEIKIIKAGK